MAKEPPIDAAVQHSAAVASAVRALIETIPEHELRFAVIGEVGEHFGLDGLRIAIKAGMERYNAGLANGITGGPYVQ